MFHNKICYFLKMFHGKFTIYSGINVSRETLSCRYAYKDRDVSRETSLFD